MKSLINKEQTTVPKLLTSPATDADKRLTPLLKHTHSYSLLHIHEKLPQELVRGDSYVKHNFSLNTSPGTFVAKTSIALRRVGTVEQP